MYRFRWLYDELGREALESPPACPTPEEFPERFDGSVDSLTSVTHRIAERIGVDVSRVDLQIYEREDSYGELMRSSGLEGSWTSDGAAGTYQEQEVAGGARYTIRIERSVAQHPTSAVATLAHELCHARLLGERHLVGDEEDGEPLTDLATVFFGYGIFTANSLVRETSTELGWSVGTQGYLTFPIVGFALALYTDCRGDLKPSWRRHLRPDARSTFEQAIRYLRKHGLL